MLAEDGSTEKWKHTNESKSWRKNQNMLHFYTLLRLMIFLRNDPSFNSRYLNDLPKACVYLYATVYYVDIVHLSLPFTQRKYTSQKLCLHRYTRPTLQHIVV